MQAAYFQDGKFQRHAELSEAGALLLACGEAAAAARLVPTGQPSISQALCNPSLYPCLLGAIFAAVAHSFAWVPPEIVAAPLYVMASMHIPLSLLALGATLERAPVATRHIYPVRTVLAIRLLSGLFLGALMLCLSPQTPPYAMRASAMAVCLIAPIAPEVCSCCRSPCALRTSELQEASLCILLLVQAAHCAHDVRCLI
jgi:predicted permease